MTAPGASADPYAALAKLQVRVSLFEDAAGARPYAGALTLPDEFKEFKSVIVKDFFAEKTLLELPRVRVPELSPQTPVFALIEVAGLDAQGKDVARGRCALSEIKASILEAHVCRPFFGLVGKWNTMESLKRNRWQFGAVAAADGRVVVGGGLGYFGAIAKPVDTIEVFAPPTTDADPTGHWTEVPNKLSAGRFDLTATALPGGNFVVFAGGRTSETSYSNAQDKFNLLTTTLDATAGTLTAARGEHSASLFGNNQLALVGGFSAASTPATPGTEGIGNGLTIGSGLRRPCVADLGSKLFVCGGSDAKACASTEGASVSAAGALSIARPDVKCGAVSGKVFLIGGTAATGGADVDVFDGTQVTKFAEPTPTVLLRHAVATANGKLVISGGYPDADQIDATRNGAILDPVAGTVKILAGASSTLSPHAWHELVAFPDGTVMAVGGKPGDPSELIAVERFVVPD